MSPTSAAVVLLALSGLASSAGARDLDGFSDYLDGVVATQFDEHRLAGVTIALVYEGELALTRGYGHADVEAGVRVDPERHLFRPGSVSKLVTWTAVMQLVERGQLDLDADLGQYLPGFRLPNAFGQPLTMTHLMTHTPGLEDGGAGFLFRDSPQDLVPLAQSLDRHRPRQVRPPGRHAAYSNWGAALAGLVVARVSGQRFEDYVAEHIFAPLGMQRSTFIEPLPPALAPDMAVGYIERQGGLEPLGFEFISNFGPAGALSSTATDMARFMRAHLGDGAVDGVRILRADTLRSMHAHLHGHDPRLDGMAHGFIETSRNGYRFIGHGGDTIAFHSMLLLHPETGFGLFVSLNSLAGAQARTRITDAVIDWFFPGEPALPAFPDTPLAGHQARIAAVAGAYRLNRRSYTRLEGVLALVSDVPVVPAGDGAIEVAVPQLGGRFVEVQPWVFRQQGRQQLLVFEPDDNDHVQHAYLQSLPIMVADRLAPWQRGGVHLAAMALALLAALFVLINGIRNSGRVLRLKGPPLLAQLCLMWAAASFLAFAVGVGFVLAGADLERVVFDFPPPGTALTLAFAVAGAAFTSMAAVLLIPVWRTPQCSFWPRVRYAWTLALFAGFSYLLWYWNMLGWRY